MSQECRFDLLCFVAKREDIFAHDPFDPLVFRFHMFVELICDFWMPFEMERKNAFNKNSSHSIHVWYIYQVNIPYMDGMGLLKFCGHVLFPTEAPAQKQVYQSTEDFPSVEGIIWPNGGLESGNPSKIILIYIYIYIYLAIIVIYCHLPRSIICSKNGLDFF